MKPFRWVVKPEERIKMKDIEYQVIDDMDEVWFIAGTMEEAKKRMKQIASEPENEWLKFHIEIVEYIKRKEV